MDLSFNTSIIKNYKSPSQISRVLTENWVKNNIYCMNCGNDNLNTFENNKPVADFYCSNCKEEYELKSKNGKLGIKIVDGAYHTMIDRINSVNNPNFFFLTYNKSNWTVNNFLMIPKHYFVTDYIEKRKPLAKTAKRAGWVGCNILLKQIPNSGRIYLIKESEIINKSRILKQWQKVEFLKSYSLSSRGWLIDVLNCIDSIPTREFSLEQIYQFEELLEKKHPKNNFIKDKIRQQLQILRDKDIILFVSRGIYRKI